MPTQALLADFTTQFDAYAAVQKLYAMGLPGEHVQLFVQVRDLGVPSSYDTSSTVVGQTMPEASGTADDALQEAPLQPQLTGRAQVTVQLPCAVDEATLTDLLRAGGAGRIRHLADAEVAPNPAMWPEPDRVSEEDATRARSAARRGAGLDDPTETSESPSAPEAKRQR